MQLYVCNASGLQLCLTICSYLLSAKMAPKEVPTAMATGIPLPRLRLRVHTIAMITTGISLLQSLRAHTIATITTGVSLLRSLRAYHCYDHYGRIIATITTGVSLLRSLRAYHCYGPYGRIPLLRSLRAYHCYSYKAYHAWPQLLVYHGQGDGHAMATGVLWLRVWA